MNIFRKPSEKLSIQKCLLRDMYKLASMGVNMSKEEYLCMLQLCLADNISIESLIEVMTTPLMIRDAYPIEEREKLHFFRHLISMMLVDRKYSKDKIEYCEYIGNLLGYDKEFMTQMIVSQVGYIPISYFVFVGNQEFSDNLLIGDMRTIFNTAEHGVEYINKEYKTLSKEGRIEALIFCLTFHVDINDASYSRKEDKLVLADECLRILNEYLLYNTDISDTIAFINNRVIIYQHLRKDIDPHMIKTLFYDYPCCIDAPDKYHVSSIIDAKDIQLLEELKKICEDLCLYFYGVPF